MNVTPHIIRLRDPWERLALADGGVRLARRFGKPTGLAAEDRVELVIVPRGAALLVQLNEQRLGEVPPSGPAWRLDVTARLASRNELVVTGLTGDASPPTVRLEISAAAKSS